MKKITLLLCGIFLYTFSFSQAPDWLWAKRIGGTGHEQGNAVTLDASGNIYVMGDFAGGAIDFDPGPGIFNLSSSGSFDIFISKLDASGNFLWAKKIGGSNLDHGSSMVLDAAGNIYITGGFDGTADFDPGAGIFNLTPAGVTDVFICKLDASGNFLWAKTLSGTNYESGYSITTDAAGNNYVTGYFAGTTDFEPGAGVFNLTSAGGNDIFISKLDASGNFVWAKQMGGTGPDEGYSVKIDASGNIYTTGFFRATVDFDPGIGVFNLTSAGVDDSYISKLDASGNFISAVRMGGSLGDERGYSLALDPVSGDVYSKGRFTWVADFDPGPGVFNLSTGTVASYYVLKLDSSLNFIWAKKTVGQLSEITNNSIILDASGNTYHSSVLMGTADVDPGPGVYNLTSEGETDILITKLDASGNFVWAKAMGGTTYDIALSLVLNASGNLFSTGYFRSPTINFGVTTLTNAWSGGNTNDIFIVKLDTSCNLPPTATITASGPACYCYLSGSVTLNANTGTGLTYQWRRFENVIPGATSSSYTVNEAGPNDFDCVVTNSCGSTTSNTITVWGYSGIPNMIATMPPYVTTFCTGYSATLTAGDGPCHTYQWRNNGVDIPGATSQYYTATTTGIYDCRSTNPCGMGISNSITVNVNAPPYITQHPQNNFVCAGGNTSFSVTATGAGLTYQWQEYSTNIVNGGVYSGATTNTLTLTGVPSNFDLRQYRCVVSGTCSPAATSNAATLSVGAVTTPAVFITGPSSLCANASGTYQAFPQNAGLGPIYQWKINGVNAGTNSLTFFSGPLNNGDVITCTLTATGGCSTTPAAISNPITVTVTPLPVATITASGPTTFCSPGSVTLNVNTGSGLTYQWRQNGVNITGEINSSFLTSAGGNFDCVVTNSCGSVTSNTITVRADVLPSAAATAAGPVTFCSPGSVTLNVSTCTGCTYQWRESAVNISGANSSSYSATASGNYDCVVSNTCGARTSNSIIVTAEVTPTASITPAWPTVFCSPGSVTLNANTGTGLLYQWRMNGTNISGATSSSYSATSTGNYDCVVSNTCGSLTSNAVLVTAENFASSTITTSGPTTFCSPGTVTLYADYGGGLYAYQWLLNNSPAPGPFATSSAYVATSGGTYQCLIFNTCGMQASDFVTVTILTLPSATITASGATTFCSLGSVLLNANTGTGLFYQWRLNGGNISGATASFYSATASGNYSCVVTNTCGSTTSNSISVTVNSPPSAVITAGGTTTFCSPGSVILNANTGSGLSYQWRLNNGNISGATSASYVATTGGSYSCVVTNSCGSSTSNSITVTVNSVPAAPGSITGQTSGVCASVKAYSISAVANATGYIWSIPSGATLSSGQGTVSINVTYTNSFTSGVVSVVASNACGSSGTSSITVTGVPAQPGNISGPISVCHNQNNVIYSIAAVTGATSYTWTVPTGTQIKTGQGTIQIKVRFGNSAGNITVRANNSCGSSAVRTLAITMPCREGEKFSVEEFSVNVFPNPSGNDFTFVINTFGTNSCSINIFDLTGRVVETHQHVSANNEFKCGEGLTDGIYFAEVISGDERKVLKLIKQK